jgi:hypothetical protein
MSRRTPRIEIKVVTESGTIEYRHAKGDTRPDGTPSAGPSDEEFAKAQFLILEYVGALWPPRTSDEP